MSRYQPQILTMLFFGYSVQDSRSVHAILETRIAIFAASGRVGFHLLELYFLKDSQKLAERSSFEAESTRGESLLVSVVCRFLITEFLVL